MNILNYWTPCTWFGLGDIMVLVDGRQMSVISPGMSNYGQSGLDDPHWPEKVNETVSDGTITWMCIQAKRTVFIPEWMGPGTPANTIFIPFDQPEPEPEVFNLFEEREI